VAQKTYNQLGDFLLLKKIGEGGMGTVFKARQLSVQRYVAVKVLPKHLAKDERFVERFYREARASARLDHPNIVRGIAVGQELGFHYFAMEYVEGKTCADLVERLGPLPVPDAVRIGIDVCRALAHAHSRNIVHRDVKPENIMVTPDGQVKLTDLGLAKHLDQDSGLTQTSIAFGTPYFMAPEQAKNPKAANELSDVYALGATLYYLLAGKVPFEGESALEVLTAKAEGRYTPLRQHNPDVPERLELTIDKMMAADPRQRFQSAAEAAEALERTGLASDRVDLVAAKAAAAQRQATAATKPEVSVEESTAPAVEHADVYYVRYRDRAGRVRTAQGSKHQIRNLIRQGRLGTHVEAAKSRNGPFRPLLAFPEFADLMKSRVIKELGDKVTGGGLADKFEQLDRLERRRRFIRRLKYRLRQAASLLVLAGLLAGAGYLGWKGYNYYKEHAADRKPPAPRPFTK